MEDDKSKLAAKLKSAHNILVTVKSNPSVDLLAAAISMTLVLNKLDKHATTVFSGKVPPVLDFLQPERTIEKDTNSLQDFIISLDKSKADKLRYKLEDDFVKIYITPYHTSIDEKDLVFEQGEVNVDLVVALGVHQREELDNAITAHGRILHDAAIATVNTLQPSTIGSINWSNNASSSICEMLIPLIDALQPEGLIDVQVANALLTGIVAETDRFSNEKTTSATMNIGSRLLASGANQQLVSTQLKTEEVKDTPKPIEVAAAPETPPAPTPTPTPAPVPEPPADKKPEEPQKPADNHVLLKVDHGNATPEVTASEAPKEVAAPAPDPNGISQVQIDEQGKLKNFDDIAKSADKAATPKPADDAYKLVINPEDLDKISGDQANPVAPSPPAMSAPNDTVQSSTSVPDFLSTPAPVTPTPEIGAIKSEVVSDEGPSLDSVRQQVSAAFGGSPAAPSSDEDVSASASLPPMPQFGPPPETSQAASSTVDLGIKDSESKPGDVPPPPVPPPFSPKI
jgi:hypothetical protein